MTGRRACAAGRTRSTGSLRPSTRAACCSSLPPSSPPHRFPNAVAATGAAPGRAGLELGRSARPQPHSAAVGQDRRRHAQTQPRAYAGPPIAGKLHDVRQEQRHANPQQETRPAGDGPPQRAGAARQEDNMPRRQHAEHGNKHRVCGDIASAHNSQCASTESCSGSDSDSDSDLRREPRRRCSDTGPTPDHTGMSSAPLIRLHRPQSN
jgi:hypothetical protein